MLCSHQGLLTVASLCRSLYACSITSDEFGTHFAVSQKVLINTKAETVVAIHARHGLGSDSLLSNLDPIHNKTVVNPYHFLPLTELSRVDGVGGGFVESTAEPLRAAGCTEGGAEPWAQTLLFFPVRRNMVSVWMGELYLVLWPALVNPLLASGKFVKRRVVLACALADLLVCALKIASTYYYSRPTTDDYLIMLSFLAANTLVCTGIVLSDAKWLTLLVCLVSLTTSFFGTTAIVLAFLVFF